MTFTALYIAAGILFVVMALSSSLLKRLPLTTSLVYLAVGFALGPRGAGLLDLKLPGDDVVVERITEVAVIISLFTAGLKLRVEWSDPLWRIPARLAFLSMTITIGLIALFGMVGLGLSIGAAILLGAVLAPTDPVLASDVQVTSPLDRDRLRFGLTGEAGLNDGTAFPFVMLGLGLLGFHQLGTAHWRWFAIDVLWAIIGGLVIGAVLGTVVGQLVLFLRRKHKEAVGLDDFIVLGLIALAYGVALGLHTYGFLAVFAAGLAVRRIEYRTTGENVDEIRSELDAGAEDAAYNPDTAPAYMARVALGFNEQLERIGEVIVVVLVGVLLSTIAIDFSTIWFVAALFLVVRPLAVAAGLYGSGVTGTQRRLIAWFGIRGIGSLYYLAYALAHGVTGQVADQLVEITLLTIAISTVIHGISVTPIMTYYERRLAHRNKPESLPAPS